MPAPRAQILFASSDAAEQDRVRACLASAGCHVLPAADGAAALRLARTRQPDLALLDLHLPGFDGLDVCKQLRRDPATTRLPIFILSQRNHPTDRLLALELGADDFLPLPCDPRELCLRVRNMIARTRPTTEPTAQVHLGELVVDLSAHEVSVAGRQLRLSPTEFKLLTALLDHQGHVQTRAALLHQVWANASLATDRTVDTHIRRLRAKLGKLRSWIHTVRNTGYCLKPQ
ncbi:MAG: DNA-binding response regulator [Pedosphaera sp. Tous-C6FEB]|nr:MAG: DNA-binding response regulator [Pedosphaera sp. Tous-C6FEB]